MRVRNIKNKYEILKESSYVVDNPLEYKNNWSSLFGNNNSIYLEIGSGKGKFLYELAKRNPNNNYIGIERIDTVLALAILNISQKEVLSNLKFINYDAFSIDELFNHDVEEIYLNFSDPWPKKRHEKRRLTSLPFLQKYDIIFKSDMIINLKTDNSSLFEYSIISLSNYNYHIKEISLDLHSNDDFNNIMTEYEEKFSKKGCKIYYLKAVKNNIHI